MKNNPQLDNWRGEFGDAYTARSPANCERIDQAAKFWDMIFGKIEKPQSILEVGANVGTNLMAIRGLSDAVLYAVEPNDRARSILEKSNIISPENIRAASAQELPFISNSIDLVFTAGVLIHIAPDDLLGSCSEIHRCSRRYILCSEYFSDQPEQKSYRGHNGLLFLRDFGSYYLDSFSDLELVDYGFLWRRTTGIDNQTWWLFRKQ